MSENKEYVTQPQENGTVNISEDVLSSIAALAAAEVEGVCGLAANFSEDIADLLGRKNLGKGVRLVLEEDGVNIECNVVVSYGYAIPEVAKNVQDSVYASVESMSGMHVKAVNVNICGISMGKENKK